MPRHATEPFVQDITAPISTNTNTTKLALTGLQPGQEVLVTQEANRLEKYIGGDIDDDANWLVLVNTVELIVENGNTLTINGVAITTDDPTPVGWFKTGESIPLAYIGPGDNPPPELPIEVINGLYSTYWSIELSPLMIQDFGTAVAFVLPSIIPSRAQVIINATVYDFS